MMYPYMTLDDNTEITHSSYLEDGTVKVYIETPVNGGFNHATCILPSYKWESVFGYSKEQMREFDEFMHHNAHLIIEFAQAGGFANAAAINSEPEEV